MTTTPEFIPPSDLPTIPAFGGKPPTPEGCVLTAQHTGDGWLLAVELHDLSDVVAILDWPESWPEEITEEQLMLYGFRII